MYFKKLPYSSQFVKVENFEEIFYLIELLGAKRRKLLYHSVLFLPDFYRNGTFYIHTGSIHELRGLLQSEFFLIAFSLL